MRTIRITEIENYIYEKKNVSLDELMEKFSVSKNTIRRDIDYIVKNTSIIKTYGGVTVPNKGENTLSSYTQRSNVNSEQKLNIAMLAGDEIEDGDTIYIDSGTTTTKIIDYIENKRVTIITNNLNILISAVKYPSISVISLPGELLRDTLSLVGPLSIEFLSQFNISKSFMSTTGFSIDKGVTNSSPLESGIKEMAISKSGKIYLMADMSKYNYTALMTYSTLKDIDVLLTNGAIPKELSDFCDKNDIVIKNK